MVSYPKLRSILTTLQTHFLHQAVGMSPFIHHEEHVTNVYADAPSKMRIEKDVARQTIPVTIEGQTDKFALAIEHG